MSKSSVLYPLPPSPIPALSQFSPTTSATRNTINLPPTDTPYTLPINCTWSRAAVEILRSSTPEPTTGDSFWIIEKDVTKYSSLLRQPNLTLAVTLPKAVNGVFAGFYQLNLTFVYYSNENSTIAVNLPLPLLPQTDEFTMEKSEEIPRILAENYSPNAYDIPADLIIPIFAIAGEGFWFKIETGSDVKQKGLESHSTHTGQLLNFTFPSIQMINFGIQILQIHISKRTF